MTLLLSSLGRAQCAADFSYGTANLDAFFTNLSVNPFTSYDWDFGDGNTSTAQDPNHTYSANGTYTVCLTIFYNDSVSTCTDSVCYPVTIFDSSGGSGCVAVANFSSSSAGNSAFFTNLSSGPSPTYAWDFGDGNTSTATDPNHTYAFSGTYLVCLTITATDSLSTCFDTQCYSVFVQDSSGSGCSAIAGFTWTSNLTTASFTNTSSGVSPTYSWDFGDGNNSTSTDPVHNYATPGTYLVCLTITAADSAGTCTDVICNSVTVQDSIAGTPAIDLDAFKLYPNPTSNLLTVSFDSAPNGGAIRVLDLAGREMMQVELEGQLTKFQVSELPGGVYLLQVLDLDQQTIGLKRFIKQ